jgi:hypothetical protein
MSLCNAMKIETTSALSARAHVRGARAVQASTTAPARAMRRSSLIVRAATEEEMIKKYPLGGDVYKVELDCSQSNIQLGLLLQEGPDGRPAVKTVRPGGTAKGKVSVGDVILATTYTELKGVSEKSWGSAARGWIDTEEIDYAQTEAAMTTNSSSLGMILSKNYKATGIRKVNVDSDVKAWAAKIAAEARAKRAGN